MDLGTVGSIIKKTAGVLGITGNPVTKNDLGLNVPSGLLTSIISFERGDTGTGFQNLAESIQDISVAAQILYCFGMVVTSPASMMNVLFGMAGNLCGTMAQITNNIMNAVMQQIGMAIDTVISSVLGAVNAVWTLLNSILELTAIILNIPNFIKQIGLGKYNSMLNRDQCEELIAAIMACLLNKFLGDPFAEFQKKIITKVNEIGYNVNQAISDEFYDLNVCAAYVEQEAFLLNKCSHQMEGLYTHFGMELDPSVKAKESAKKDKQKATVDTKGKVSVKGTNTKTSAKDNEYATFAGWDKAFEEQEDPIFAEDRDPMSVSGGDLADGYGGPSLEAVENSERQRLASTETVPAPDVAVPVPAVDEYQSPYAPHEQDFGIPNLS